MRLSHCLESKFIVPVTLKGNRYEGNFQSVLAERVQTSQVVFGHDVFHGSDDTGESCLSVSSARPVEWAQQQL